MAAGPVGAAADGFRAFSRYVGGVMGADAYQKYLEHHASTEHGCTEHSCTEHGCTEHGCTEHGGPPLTEKAFWRDRTDRQDTNPQGRCC
ncbi:YbdD/YjiX family protein [Pseudarthrobacter sp. N5]|uniref:YbdD/YjiX family protein n=1 Tax=Pseudarthrobacter sp. N5 TaxID=3418416 RepID=UPI003CEF4343